MEDAIIKTELHERIDHADGEQLKEIYGLLTNYFNGKQTLSEWDAISPVRKERLEQSIRQAEEGLFRPARDIILETREKYRLNE
jgi:hypothetical protein